MDDEEQPLDLKPWVKTLRDRLAKAKEAGVPTTALQKQFDIAFARYSEGKSPIEAATALDA